MVPDHSSSRVARFRPDEWKNCPLPNPHGLYCDRRQFISGLGEQCYSFIVVVFFISTPPLIQAPAGNPDGKSSSATLTAPSVAVLTLAAVDGAKVFRSPRMNLVIEEAGTPALRASPVALVFVVFKYVSSFMVPKYCPKTTNESRNKKASWQFISLWI
jgi:hypothetical protein